MLSFSPLLIFPYVYKFLFGNGSIFCLLKLFGGGEGDNKAKAKLELQDGWTFGLYVFCFVVSIVHIQFQWKYFVNLPTASSSTVRKTAITTRVMQLVHQILNKRIHVTKRDLFYTDVKLFQDQRLKLWNEDVKACH